MLVGNFIIHNLYDPINNKIIELKEDYAFPIYGPIGLTMLCNCMSLIEDCIGNMNFVCIFLPHTIMSKFVHVHNKRHTLWWKLYKIHARLVHVFIKGLKTCKPIQSWWPQCFHSTSEMEHVFSNVDGHISNTLFNVDTNVLTYYERPVWPWNGHCERYWINKTQLFGPNGMKSTNWNLLSTPHCVALC